MKINWNFLGGGGGGAKPKTFCKGIFLEPHNVRNTTRYFRNNSLQKGVIFVQSRSSLIYQTVGGTIPDFPRPPDCFDKLRYISYQEV